MILVTDIDWNLEGWVGKPCDYGLPDMVTIEVIPESLPYNELIAEIAFYLEVEYGFRINDCNVKVLENNKGE